MSIQNNIEAVMASIRDDSTVGDDVQAKAASAIMAGLGSEEWAEYMSMFATDEEELARLLPTDASAGVFDMDVARTYLVGNGMCGAASTGTDLGDGVGDTLDQDLT